MAEYVCLCDDKGIVSDELVKDNNPFDKELTYRKLLNNLRKHSNMAPYLGEPFPCTGSVHLAGLEFICTSDAHKKVTVNADQG